MKRKFFKAKLEKRRDLLSAYFFLERVSEILLPIADGFQLSDEES
jgi:hypothetical protein